MRKDDEGNKVVNFPAVSRIFSKFDNTRNDLMFPLFVSTVSRNNNFIYNFRSSGKVAHNY
jgi:hypothetical protein